MDEISMILFSRSPFTNDPIEDDVDWATEYSTRLSNTTTTGTPIRFKMVNAEMPDVSPDTVTDEFGGKRVKWANRTIQFEDSDFSNENYAWHQKAICMGELRFWYVIGGYIYGGKSGIRANFQSIPSSVQSGDSITNKFKCEIAFRIVGIADRALLPV
jgi:hypothetical protein